MTKLFEKYGDEASAKDGGFVFQAIVSHDVRWEIDNGETKIDPKKINCVLHQVDIFPDMKFKEGYATSSYVVLSEVNILKRKFELASEALKKRIKPEYGVDLLNLASAGTGISAVKIKELNEKYFKNTYFEASLTTDHIVLREVSTSGLNSGRPQITLKLSTGMVDTLDGQPTGTWDKFKVTVDGTTSISLDNSGDEPISRIKERDDIENIEDIIFRTIVPSLILEFIGESVAIDTYSHRSTMVSAGAAVDYDNLFTIEDTTKEAEAKPTA